MCMFRALKMTLLLGFFVFSAPSYAEQESPGGNMARAESQGISAWWDITNADIKSLMQKAEAGDAEAQSVVGEMYLYGKGVPRDNAEALRWFRKAARQDNARAQYGIGEMYLYGNGGVNRNYDKAYQWLRKAAEQDDANAQSRIAQMYLYGKGVPQGDDEVCTWVEQIKAKYGLEEPGCDENPS